jgi:hypothetical protein
MIAARGVGGARRPGISRVRLEPEKANNLMALRHNSRFSEERGIFSAQPGSFSTEQGIQFPCLGGVADSAAAEP